MPAVSVLHSPRDEALGEKIADALAREGHATRRLGDDPLSGDLLLEDGAAIVIWSNAAEKLVRLHTQAREALERGALIPVTIGGASAPSGFEALQPVDLSGWGGDANDPRWRFILEEIALASRRALIEDGSVWKEAEEQETQTALSEPETDPPIGFVSQRDPQAPPAPSCPVPEYAQANETNPEFSSGPIEVEANYEVSVDYDWSADAAPKRKPFRFNTGQVAVGGAVALAALALGAVTIAPSIFSPASQTEEAAAVDIAPSIAFVQPASPVEDEGASSAEIKQQSDFEVTSYREDVDPDNVADAAAQSPSLEEASAPAAPILDAEENLLADNAAAEEFVDESLADEERQEEPVLAETEQTDSDELETLIAAVTSPETAPNPLADLPEDVRNRINLGNYFADCEACPQMASLPAGSFRFGSPQGEAVRQESEGPVTEISLARPFAIATREVTYTEWEACVDEGGCKGYRPYDMGWGRDDRPVVNVSYEDAQSYVAWLSAKTGERYRLPSEAEWEFAARGGVSTAFSFGGGVSADQANFNANYPYGADKGAYRERTTPAGSFAPNNFGLYDMHGNVWEWTQDCWSPSHAGAPTDGAAVGGECAANVIKGGAWNTGGWRLRAGHRLFKTKIARENDIGFRVARDME